MVPLKNEATSNPRRIPAEIVEEILLHLPVKSVLRFSSVSKSWRSIISQPRFIQRYENAAARARILISPFSGELSIRNSSCSLSSISSGKPIQDATKIITPFKETPYLYVIASCDDMWCVKVRDSLFLWNPSMNIIYKKIENSSPLMSHCYGFGYDCVADDYKILKISVHDPSLQTTELYSLRKDSWSDKVFKRDRTLFWGGHNLRNHSDQGAGIGGPGVFVSGALHWMDYSRNIIVYFDLTTEMCGVVKSPTTSRYGSYIGVIVLRRKLCTYLNNYKMANFVLWVMQDYGVDKPWTILFEIQSTNGLSHFPSTGYCFRSLNPLYLYDNGDVLIEIKSRDNNVNIFIWKNRNAIPKEIVGSDSTKIWHSYVYVESLVSPAMRWEAGPAVN